MGNEVHVVIMEEWDGLTFTRINEVFGPFDDEGAAELFADTMNRTLGTDQRFLYTVRPVTNPDAEV
jgi:hypothetical protein